MRVELRIPSSLVDWMRADLAQPNPFGGERVGFMATRSINAVDTLVVTAHDYRPVMGGDYMRADDAGVRIGTPAIRSAMEWGMSERQGIWHLHAHGGWGSPPMMSGTDEADIPRLAHALTCSSPTEIHGLMILNQDRAMAEAWVPGAGRSPVAVMEMGWPMSSLSRVTIRRSAVERYARQNFLGPEGTSMLAGIRIGIVGAGGGGSHLFQQMVHIGVGDLTVFDPDIIEETNLPRTVGATEQDVLERRPKVEIAERLARAVHSTGTVHTHRTKWQEYPEALRRCHVVMGAVDTFAERRELEVACRRFLIPYIDIGMDVAEGRKPGFRMAGQVIATIPGGPCMWCLDFLTEDRMAQEARKYGTTGRRPQVVWANGILASSAIGLAIDLITGWTDEDRGGAYLTYDGNYGTLTQHPLWLERKSIHCPHFPLEECGSPVLKPVRSLNP